MFKLTDQPLTPAIAATLPSGAHKLLAFAQIEPGATNSRYCELTGYSERSIRSFITALVKAGLAERVQASKSEHKAPEESSPGYQILTAAGMAARQARRFARMCDPQLITAAVNYVNSKGPRDQAAYLVWSLEHPECWYKPAPMEYPNSIHETQAPLNQANNSQTSVMNGTVHKLTTTIPATNRSTSASSAVTVNTKPTAELELLAYSVSVACGIDFTLHPEYMLEIELLYKAGYTAEDVGYFLKEYWPTIWPGKTGEPPTLKALLEHIGHSKHLLEMASNRAAGDELIRRIEKIRRHLNGQEHLESLDDLLPEFGGQAQLNPYLNHPRYKTWAEGLIEEEAEEARRDHAAYLAANCLKCQRPHRLCKCASVAAIPGWIKSAWQTTLDQLSFHMNATTYSYRLREVQLVRYEENCLIIETYHRYNHEWLAQYLLPSLTDIFNRSCRPSMDHPKIVIDIQIKPEVE